MMRGGALWGAGALTSLAAHAGAAALLVWAINPSPVEDQPKPQTKLNMTTYQVARSQAVEATPDVAQAQQNTANARKLAAYGPALQRAQTMQAKPDKVAQSQPKSLKTPQITAPSTPLANAADQHTTHIEQGQTAPPANKARPLDLPTTALVQSLSVQSVVQPVSLVAAAPQTIFAAVVPIQAIVPQRPANEAAALVVPATPAAVPPAQLDARPAPAAVLPSVTATTEAPQTVTSADVPLSANPAATLALPASKAQAKLAFAALGGGSVDPVSLTAFQSFMQPGDLDGASNSVKDDLASVIGGLPCSRVQVRFDPLDNALIVSGHVPQDALRGSVLQAMQDKMGADIPVLDNLLILPSPQCGALAGIAGVGLPQSTDQITNPLLVGADTHAKEFRYVADQPMVLTLQGADYDAYVYVDYFDAAGNVLHLLPNAHTPMTRAPKKSAIKVGSDRILQPGEPGLFLKVGPPYGQEIAVAFAASVPLYEGVRPLSEPAAPYLDWLTDKVADAKAAHPDFKGEWVYFFVSTSAQ